MAQVLGFLHPCGIPELSSQLLSSVHQALQTFKESTSGYKFSAIYLSVCLLHCVLKRKKVQGCLFIQWNTEVARKGLITVN